MEKAAYPGAAVEWTMKVQEVILRAIDGRLKWYQAAEILGISVRQMRRWKHRYEREGYDGLFDRRRQRPSPKRVALEVRPRRPLRCASPAWIPGWPGPKSLPPAPDASSETSRWSKARRSQR